MSPSSASMLAVLGERELTGKERYLGPCLMTLADDGYLRYLNWRFAVVSREQAPESEVHRTWLKEEIERVQNAIDGQSR